MRPVLLVLLGLVGPLLCCEEVLSQLSGGGGKYATSLCDELIRPNGYTCVENLAVTGDGFKLGLQNIPSSGPPVMLMHGLIAGGDNFAVNSPQQSLAFVLATAGFDVWIANNRAIQWSHGHLTLTPSQDIFRACREIESQPTEERPIEVDSSDTSENDYQLEEYWAWTYDELASYDLEALIGFIYDRRGATKLTYIGHSEGSLLLFAGLTGGKFKMELLGYLNAAVLLAPAASIPHLMAPIVKAGLSLSIDQILIATGNKGELDSNMFLNLTCTSPLISQFACSNTFYGFLGQNNHLEHSRLGFYSQYYPQPTSSMSLNHLGQAYRTNTFEFYDKGTAGNEAAYGQPTPPKYDLTTFPASLPLQLWNGGADGLADPTDFQSTLALLPGSNREVNTLPDYGHVDFTYGTRAYLDVYPGIITFLTSHAS